MPRGFFLFRLLAFFQETVYIQKTTFSYNSTFQKYFFLVFVETFKAFYICIHIRKNKMQNTKFNISQKIVKAHSVKYLFDSSLDDDYRLWQIMITSRWVMEIRCIYTHIVQQTFPLFPEKSGPVSFCHPSHHQHNLVLVQDDNHHHTDFNVCWCFTYN